MAKCHPHDMSLTNSRQHHFEVENNPTPTVTKGVQTFILHSALPRSCAEQLRRCIRDVFRMHAGDGSVVV
eukprot:1278422-Amphidinium_carterae.1